jgi:hypothetical protein
MPPCALAPALLLLAACASSEAPPSLRTELGVSLPDRPWTDLVPHFDVYRPAVDLAPGERLAKLDGGGSCALGTPDNCGSCGKVCPGKESPATARVCLDGKCAIQCKEEWYDVNGAVDDGCEALDDLPVHDVESAAVDLGKVSDCDIAQQTTGVMPSDDRLHLKAPTDRPQGRPDWYKLHIDDKLGCVVSGKVTISLAGLPTAAYYRATVFWACDGGSKLASNTVAGGGGQKLELKPETGCTLVGDDSGTLYLKLAKESGPHAGASYSVSIEP